MDATSRGDIEAGLVREWYEKNRESWVARHSPFGAGPDRDGSHADEFMLAFIGEVRRVGGMTDAQLMIEYNGVTVSPSYCWGA